MCERGNELLRNLDMPSNGAKQLWKPEKLVKQIDSPIHQHPIDPPPYTTYLNQKSHEHSNSYAYPAQAKCHERTVFDRLTDTAYFTGVHKERFDEYGNGRGLAGREYLFVHDGLTESPSRTHEVYSSVIKTRTHLQNPNIIQYVALSLYAAKKSVVTPGTLGVQKYGVQIAAPKLMWLFRNGDKYHNGVPFFLRAHIQTLNALYYEISKKITPINGSIRKLYDQNLKQISRLEEIVDGAKYLCSSGEPPAPLAKMEKFLNPWVIQKPERRVPTNFFEI
ncbi:hypothetical protein IE077_003671 [Cardiosporidium cionae]|uniref:Doublecortin domain-containing protein n=1 Tax=Cardiosporidium cionae TaxID=476202 RepID=A0ABQ7JEP8_9APIC|nr:hypothetical protein IE077_003671 [Cardiosporidium cionae]|eukprot:KAF8822485.1 hypothetical protein IE077_003671 [Cardiosporidium cionae]